MEQNDRASYWMTTAQNDEETMRHLYDAGDYSWALFLGHLVVEKLMKAVYLCNRLDSITPPKSHDLVWIANKAGIVLSDCQSDALDLITTFNISARYPDEQFEFRKLCTREYTQTKIELIKEVCEWLRTMLPS